MPPQTSSLSNAASLEAWTRTAQRRLNALLEAGFKHRSLRAQFPASLKSPKQVQIEIRVIGSSAMRRMNQEFLAHDYATDVLSFPTASFFRELGHLGELVVCREVCVRQAREHSHRPEAELEVLLVHGLLHLLGLDHERSPEEAVQMAGFEAQWLEASRQKSSSRGLIARAGRAPTKRAAPQKKAKPIRKKPKPARKKASAKRKKARGVKR